MVGNKRSEYQRKLRKKWDSLGLCTRCGKKRVDGIKSCAKCKERYLKHNVQYHKKIKDKVFAAYGGYVCACCGITEEFFLTLDHKNNDGAKERKTLATTYRGAGGWILYLDLCKRGFPEGYQILCMNCNWGRRRLGVCPHKL